MNEGAGRFPASTMRASDADRDAMLAELSQHFQAGRLTSDELEERTGQALQARTYRDLARLTTDLPSLASIVPPSPATSPGWAWPLASVPVVLVALAVVASALIATGMGGRGSSVWWLVLIVPLVARRISSRRRR